MVRGVLTVALLAVCGVVQVAAQGASKGPLGAILAPHEHARPVAPNAPHIADVSIDATKLGSPLVLDKNWRVGVTANPAAAEPGFDDSAWEVRDAKSSIADVPDEDHRKTDNPDALDVPENLPPGHKRPFAWFREHVKLAPNHGPVALLIELPVTQNTNIVLGESSPGLDVFVNGKLIRPEGPHGDATFRYQEISRLYRIELAPDETNLTIAVRTIYIPVGYYAYTSFFARRTFRLGSPEDLQRVWDLWFMHNLFERLPRLVNAILLTVLSVFLLALYFTQRGHVEYLWLALHELLQAPIGFVDLAGSLRGIWTSSGMRRVLLQLVAISAYLYFEFMISFLSLRKRWTMKALRWTAPVLAGVGPGVLLLGGHGFVIVSTLVFVYLGQFSVDDGLVALHFRHADCRDHPAQF